MRFPRITPTTTLLGLLVMLMLSSILYNRESLLFCERALVTETEMLREETDLKGPVKFNEVCPEIRQRVEANTNRLLDILLALAVQFNPPHPPAQP
jgi:hypothetical protein